MTESLKILGQVAPSTANTVVTLYSPATNPATSAVVSSAWACNVTGALVTVRVHAYASGATAGVGNAIAYDVVLPARAALPISQGITLQPGAVLAVAAGTASAVTFTAFGQEITP